MRPRAGERKEVRRTDHEVRVDLRLHLVRDKEDEMLRPPLSRGTLRRHAVVATALALIALPLIASTAAADQYFHTSHADLSPIGNAPLGSGFVNDIHAQGVTISAQERYHLVGAMPNTTYTVALKIYVGDPSCTNLTRTRQTATFDTNAVGNATADFTFFVPATGPPPPNPVESGIIWVISSGGVPQYQAACVPVTLGA
jgi:hypothetical protein